MLFTIKKLPLLFVASSILFISVHSFADDGLTPGPGLFSGESGEYSLRNLFSPSSNNDNTDKPKDLKNRTEVEVSELSPTSEKAETIDYKTYQEWSALRDADPELYNDFELYLEYKEFLNSQK